MKKSPEKDPLESLLEAYQKEQREFENHWFWKKIQMTPKEFFSKIGKNIPCPFSQKVWKEKLDHARKNIETQLKEKYRNYKLPDQRLYQAIKI